VSKPAPEPDGRHAPQGAGVPVLFAVNYSAIGFSICFALGLVADRGLGLTPLIFLGVGLVFLLNTLTYIEGVSMFGERGGSATLARRAFNELVSFVAGWAILIDYVIVIALAAISVPHYLTPVWSGFSDTGAEIIGGAVVIAVAAAMAVLGITGVHRARVLLGLALSGVALFAAVIVVGLLTSFDPGAITDELDLFTSPTFGDVVYAGVIGTVAFAGIEAASNLAPDLRVRAGGLRLLVLGAVTLVPLAYAGVALVGLMAVPVVPTADGPQTALGTTHLEDPVLGIVQSYDPGWVADVMEVAVVAVVPVALVWAASIAMLGVSRHVYVLATNRQIPSWLGKLNGRYRTPHIAIGIAALMSLVLVAPTDVEVLGGLFAFGGTIAFTIAHLSIIKLRIADPDRRRPFRIPLDVSFRGARVPLPAILAAVLTALAWVSVVILHDEARWLGMGWMLLGLVGYAVYRIGFEGTTLTQRVEVPEEALVKDVREAEYGDILVPVFGTKLDDDIVGTAGRLADAAVLPTDVAPKLEVVYVIDLPLTVPLNAPPLKERLEVAEAALERAKDVAEEYETVDVRTSMVRARNVGAGIVEAARTRGVEVIVMGAEPPTRIKGGAILGGIGGARPKEIGPVTEYVLKRAPCPVLITAPPAEEDAAGSPAEPIHAESPAEERETGAN
jgi:APA family basic amino acid/polyamine antiporter